MLGGLLGGGPDKPKEVKLDPRAQELINQSLLDASRSTDDISQGLSVGTERADTLAPGGGGEINNQLSSLGIGGPGADIFGQALRTVYNQKAGPAMEMQKKERDQEAFNYKTKKLRNLSAVAQAQQNVKNQNFQMLTDAYNQNQMARAGFVSSLFQIAGTAQAIRATQQPKTLNLPGTIHEGYSTPGTPGAYSPDGSGMDFSNIG